MERPMNSWLNYHHLFYFMTIAEEGSVSKAAKKLSIGQPTLSTQLKQFEENIDIRLFEREHKKLIITEQGKIALDYARTIFKTGLEMIEVLNDRIQPLNPTLHIGALDSIPKNFILKLTQKALNFTDCQITLTEANFDVLLKDLSAHKIDLVLSNFVPIGIDAKAIFPKLIIKKNISIYSSYKYKHLKRNFPKSISTQPLVFPTYDSKLRPDLDHWAQLNEIELNIVVESQDIEVKKLMAINGIGLIAASSHSVEQQVKNKELIELGRLEDVYEELYILSTKRKIANEISNYLINNFII